MNSANRKFEIQGAGYLDGEKVAHVHDPRAIANFFIRKLNLCTLPATTKERVTPLALQKLLFIAHALSLLDLERPLVNEAPRVGRFDPYFPTLRDAISYFGGDNVPHEVTTGTAEQVYENSASFPVIRTEFDCDEIEILEAVWNMYEEVNFDCTRLTFLTGGNPSEFKQLTNKFKRDGEISNTYIMEVISERLFQPRNLGSGDINGKMCSLA